MRIISILGVTMRFAAVTSVVLVLTGCSSFFPPASERELGSAGYWLNYDAARRGAVVLKKTTNGDNYAYCAEQSPDVAMTLVTKLTGDIKAGNTSISNLDAESTATAVQLAGRTQLVLLTRESLYRLCEISMNQSMDKDTMLKMMTEISGMIKSVADNEIQQAKKDSDIAKAKAQAIAAATEATKGTTDSDIKAKQLIDRLKF
ncbi:hypothetical protein MAFF301560_27780 [Ralstonia solanacearum]|nr:hypothetical protein MAFF301560_27780 [Ralstonia solanacearum]BEU45856.1 hypothetical protein MAFF211519_11810 [Ralstonia pseudosolanacearum]